jgi:ESX secretion system ATPase EccB
MWTQRDQLQAYQFLRRRVVSALVAGDANHPASPSRRLLIGCAVGLACALLATAGFGVYGLLSPGSGADWQKSGQVLLDRDTGATYVLGADKRLHPMLNYASARLLAGGDGSATVQVSASVLGAAPRGATLGIPGAPDTLPSADDLLRGPWAVCTQRPADRPANAAPVTTALLGARPTGAAVPARAGLLLRGPDGTGYLLAGGRRYRVDGGAVLVALGLDRAAPVPVGWSFLDALPAGPDLKPIPVTDAGTAKRIGSLSTVVGQVLRVRPVNGGPRYYLVRDDGVYPVGETEASLVLAAGGPGERDVPASALGDAVRPAESSSYPARPPRPLSPPAATAVCVSGGRITLGAVPSAAVTVRGGDTRTADRVYLPPARGALVRAGTVWLVTDQGIRYPIADGAARSALGYGSVHPARVPAGTLALFPIGPTLSTAAAGRTAAQ